MKTKDIVCPECGTVFTEKHDRSRKSHRHFFAVLSAAYHQWPESHEFQPDNSEHLRAYLLVAAKYAKVIGQNLCNDEDIQRVVDFTKRLLRDFHNHGGYGFVEISGEKSIIVKFPRSLSFKSADGHIFNEVSKDVFEIIESVIGVSIENLVRNSENTI